MLIWAREAYALLDSTRPLPHISSPLFLYAVQVVKNLPRMQAPGEEQMYRNYPVTGTSALFALDPGEREGQADRQTGRRVGGQGQTNRQAGRQAGRHAGTCKVPVLS